MPKRSDTPRKQQVLIRLTQAEFDVIDAAAHLYRATPAAYVYSLIQAHIGRLGSDAHVQADLANRRDFEWQSATVSDIGAHSRQPEANATDSSGRRELPRS